MSVAMSSYAVLFLSDTFYIIMRQSIFDVANIRRKTEKSKFSGDFLIICHMSQDTL